MKASVIIVLFLSFMSNQIIVRGQDREVKKKTAIHVNCGDIVETEFGANYEQHTYKIKLNAGDDLKVSIVPLGDQLKTSISLLGPTGLAIINSDVKGNLNANGTYNVKPEKRPSLTSGKLSATGEYTVDTRDFSTGYYGAGDPGGIGVYTIYFSCTLRDGTAINPGDTAPASSANGSNGSAPVAPAFSGTGFPGLAPVDFSAVAKIPMIASVPMTGGVAPTGDTILGYTFDAADNDTVALNFNRLSGNLNLGLVVLSADNKVVFQASLVTSSELTTKFTLPTAGTYTIGVFRIDLLSPSTPEATAFQLTANLNP